MQNLIGDRSERPAVRRRARVACRAVSEEGRGEIGREVTWSANGVGELRFSQALKALTAAEICELEAADHCGVGAGAEDVLRLPRGESHGEREIGVREGRERETGGGSSGVEGAHEQARILHQKAVKALEERSRERRGVC